MVSAVVDPDEPHRTRRLKGASLLETRSGIIDLIRSSGTISRVELAARSGLTTATISKIVRPLIAEGLVTEAGYADSTGGKRAVLLELNRAARYAFGVSLDTARTVYVLADLSGRPIRRKSVRGTGTSTPEIVMRRVVADLRRMLDDTGIDPSDVIGVGVAGEGRLDRGGRVLRSTRSRSDWDEFAIGGWLAAATDLPVVVDNDANCAALGEFWSARVPSTHDFATVYMASGIGCGIVVGGEIYRGASSNAGEIGHMTLAVDGPPCWCGSRGCLEMLAAPAAVVARARRTPSLVGLVGESASDEPADVRSAFARVAAAAASGEADAAELVLESAMYLSKAVLNLVNLVDLDHVYLSGPAFAEAGELYLGVVAREIRDHAVMRGVHPVSVAMSSVGSDAAALGAAAAVLHSELTSRRPARR